MFEVFDWLELTIVGQIVRESLWLFPAIEAVHLLALALLGAAVLSVDLVLLGVGIRSAAPAVVADKARPLLFAAIGLLLATGIPLFLSEAIKCFYSTAFWVKMIGLAVALLYTFTVRRWWLRSPRPEGIRLTDRLVGSASMALWFTVAAAGRWIGFS